MSYKNIVGKIKDINATVTNIKQSLDYEPTKPVTPCIYCVLDNASVEYLASHQTISYNVLIRLLLRYTANETVEQKLADFVDAIIDKYNKNVKLDGLLSNGSARITLVRAAYVPISSVVYRLVEFTLLVNETQAVAFEV